MNPARDFVNAVQFLTRIPVPFGHPADEAAIGRASAFFPLVGLIVGGIGAGVYWLASLAFGPAPSTVLALAAMALATNGFHEDGLADSFDGFGGGWTTDRVLDIMRDSRIGTYGTLALVFVVLAKFTMLTSIAHEDVWRWLLVAHATSRWTVLPLAMALPYARPEGAGKLVAHRIGFGALIVGTVTVAAACALVPWKSAAIAMGVVVVVTMASGLYYRRRIGGITGDCLGATNQLAEVAVYAVAAAMATLGARG